MIALIKSVGGMPRSIFLKLGKIGAGRTTKNPGSARIFRTILLVLSMKQMVCCTSTFVFFCLTLRKQRNYSKKLCHSTAKKHDLRPGLHGSVLSWTFQLFCLSNLPSHVIACFDHTGHLTGENIFFK